MDEQDKKKGVSFRLHPELAQWLETYASKVGVPKTAVVEALLAALREEKLWVEPDYRPDPFPGVKRAVPLPVKPYQGIQPGTYPHRQEEK